MMLTNRLLFQFGFFHGGSESVVDLLKCLEDFGVGLFQGALEGGVEFY